MSHSDAGPKRKHERRRRHAERDAGQEQHHKERREREAIDRNERPKAAARTPP